MLVELVDATEAYPSFMDRAADELLREGTKKFFGKLPARCTKAELLLLARCALITLIQRPE